MNNVLIIGGAGYIGTVLTDYLLRMGYKVRSLDKFLYRNNHCVLPYLGHERYESMYGDLCEPEIVEKALEGITDVVLLAGLVGDPITKKYSEFSEKINAVGIRSCIVRLNNHNLDRLVFVSTCSNYGLIENDNLADENFGLRLQSLCAKAKVAAV